MSVVRRHIDAGIIATGQIRTTRVRGGTRRDTRVDLSPIIRLGIPECTVVNLGSFAGILHLASAASRIVRGGVCPVTRVRVLRVTVCGVIGVIDRVRALLDSTANLIARSVIDRISRTIPRGHAAFFRRARSVHTADVLRTLDVTAPAIRRVRQRVDATQVARQRALATNSSRLGFVGGVGARRNQQQPHHQP
jgi:hypothetical protein